ncbi:MAG: hypothetical protein AAGA36_02855 [Pseudomonadota bacterium]
MHILQSVSIKGDGSINEDLAGHAEQAVWVFDGATGVSEPVIHPVSDARWFVERADYYLRGQLEAFKDKQTRAIASDVMAALSAEFSADPSAQAAGPAPSAAFAMIRASTAFEVALLGDCMVLLSLEDGTVRAFKGMHSAAVEAESLAALKAAQARLPGASPGQIRQQTSSILRRNRTKMNTPGGYWIFSTNRQAAQHMDIYRPINVDMSRPFVLVSDGFSRAIDLLENMNDEALYQRIIHAGAKAVADDIRAAERRDSHCRRVPRFKCSDDATCVVVRAG